MPREEFQRNVLKLVHQTLGGTIKPTTPKWLMRPGRAECGRQWPLVCAIYRELTNQELTETMPKGENRRLDGVSIIANSAPRVVEVDETQHFNSYRAAALQLYPPGIQLAFNRMEWIERSEAKLQLETGGFAAPKPPLFPGDGGRHRQRAFRDALCDILPPDHDFLPTLRIAYFEVPWLMASDAPLRMKELLHRKFSN